MDKRRVDIGRRSQNLRGRRRANPVFCFNPGPRKRNPDLARRHSARTGDYQRLNGLAACGIYRQATS